MKKRKQARRYRKSIPYCDGWWLWRENNNRDDERLLIVSDGKHAEVATDDCLCAVADLSYPLDPPELNYWEMTDCGSMGGLWKLDEELNLQGMN